MIKTIYMLLCAAEHPHLIYFFLLAVYLKNDGVLTRIPPGYVRYLGKMLT